MRPSLISATLATLAAAACVLAAPAGLVHADQNAQQTINQLEADGYTVNIDRVGSGRIQDCVVTSVRNPQTVTEWIRVRDGRNRDGSIDWDVIPVIRSRSISVSLDCT